MKILYNKTEAKNMTAPYPKYLYHPDFNEPRRVDSNAEEAEWGTKGWTSRYLHKEYPKWIGDKIVQSKAEEERLMPASEPEEKASSFVVDVVKELQVDGQDTTIVEKPKSTGGRPSKKK
jgi:hypothetical protein